MSNEHVKSVLIKVLLALQVCLGLWQFLKLTPVGALFKGIAGWLLRPLGLSPTYAGLKHCNGCVFKEASLCVTVAEDQVVFDEEGATTGLTREAVVESKEWFYLNVRYRLRREENQLFINDKMSYYITDIIWENLLNIIDGVYVKGCKELWKGVTIGGVMTASEVFDCLILDNHVTKKYRSDYRLLPVDLSASEEKLLKILNMAGLFFQAKNAYWLIPTFISLTSAILEFCTPLRKWLYHKFNLMFCCAMQFIVDEFSYSLRSQVYSLGNWVENLKPSNDIQLKVVKGTVIKAVIAGGAKTTKGDASDRLDDHPQHSRKYFRYSREVLGERVYLQDGIPQEERDGILEEWTFSSDSLIHGHHGSMDSNAMDYNANSRRVNLSGEQYFVIQAIFNQRFSYCKVSWNDGPERSTDTNYVELRTDREKFGKVMKLISCMTWKKSGSLKSSRGRVLKVRSLKESILYYAKSGFPTLYELQFDNAIIN